MNVRISTWRGSVLVLVCLAAYALACSPSYAIWILPGSTVEHLVFGLATRRGGSKILPVNRVEIATCRRIAQDLTQTPAHTTWLVLGWDSPPDPRKIAQLRYGDTPVGLRDSIRAQPLTTGCHDAFVSAEYGSGSLSFWAMPDGSIREISSAERDSMYAIGSARVQVELRDADSSIAKCLGLYASALTNTDSAKADSAVLNDTTRFGRYSCGWYRRYYWARFQRKP
jgi:hypothetical protein